MAKKILKRSLALGALMAFVITGSAMASGEKTVGVTNNTTYKNRDSAFIYINNDAPIDLGIEKYEVSGNGIHITGTDILGEAINENGKANLHANDLTITTTGGGNGIYTVYGAELNLTVDNKLLINSSGHGINSGATPKSSIVIDAKNADIIINAAENAIDSRGNNTKIKIDAKNISVISTNTGDQDNVWKGYALFSRADGSSVDISVTGDVDITSARTAVYANKGGIKLIGNTIDIVAGEGAGVRAGTSASDPADLRGNGQVVLGNANTESVTIEGNMSYGIIARAKNNSGAADVQSSVVVNGKSLIIGGKEGSKVDIGICAASGTDFSSEYNSSTVTVNTGYTEVNAGYGIHNMSNGRVTINGDLTINATEAAIVTRGHADTIINGEAKDNVVVKINGDIEFNKYYNNNTSVTDANVLINLTNDKSYIKGKIYVSNDSQVSEQNKATINDIHKMRLSLSNGATWYLTDESFANNVSFGAGSNLVIEGAKFVESNNKYALNGSSNDSLKVEKGANLVIEGMEQKTYNIAKGFGTNEGENFTVVNDNALMQAQMVLDKTASELKAVVTAKSAADVIASGITSTSAAGAVSQLASELSAAGGNPDNVAPANRAAAQFLNDVMSGIASGNKTAQNIKDAMDSTFNVGENVGANANAAAVVNNVSGITTQRMSFTNVSTTPQGGHGKVERKYKSGEGVWAQYMHGKDKVEDMPMSDTTTSYDSQYNGIVFGYDFKEVGKTHTGIAFNYGSGDSHGATSSTYSRSEFDFWGVGLYHSIMNDDTNLVFDINYNKSDTDVTQNGLGGLVTANPKTDTISVGVKAEKLIQNGPVQIVPYAGLRYMSINTDDYHVAALNATYSPERQNVWLIPVGVSMRQENVYENGWKVTPKADLSYIWALGDTDSSMTVAVGNVAPFTNSYTVMDNGSFLGTLGLEASKGDWTYGLSYSYQKGEYQRSDKWFVDVRYSF